MSMYRQLLAAILLSSFLAFAGSVVNSIVNTRDYLESQLRVKNQDNASAMALTISQLSADPIQVAVAVSAQFDSGNYRLIRYRDAEGRVVTERIAPDETESVPGWFQSLVPMTVPAGFANVSAGWSQLGDITLESHTSYAYESLWSSSVRIGIAALIAALAGCFLGTLILNRIKRPLDAVVGQAEAIVDKRFVRIDVPSVPELRRLAQAMNFTVDRLREMFEEEAKRLESVRRQANYDDVTALPNRNNFMAHLREALRTEVCTDGTMVLLRINQLSEINARSGHLVTDELLRRIASHLLAFSEPLPESVVGRLNGSDFAVLIPDTDNAIDVKALMEAVVRDVKPYVADDRCASIGVVTYSEGVSAGDLMAHLDGALAKAEISGSNHIERVTAELDGSAPRTMDDWVNLISAAVRGDEFMLAAYPVMDWNGHLLHYEGPLRLRFNAEGPWIPAGKFLPMAERLGLTAAIDLAAVRFGLAAVNASPAHPGMAINLSPSSLRDKTFVKSLKALLSSHAAAANRLWIELPESGVLRSFEAFRKMCLELRGTGVRIGIEHFGRDFERIGLLHDLGLHYVKVDATFVADIHRNDGNRAFLTGVVNICHAIGFLVIGEGVASPAERQTLRSLGFDAVTGPAVIETPSAGTTT